MHGFRMFQDGLDETIITSLWFQDVSSTVHIPGARGEISQVWLHRWKSGQQPKKRRTSSAGKHGSSALSLLLLMRSITRYCQYHSDSNDSNGDGDDHDDHDNDDIDDHDGNNDDTV